MNIFYSTIQPIKNLSIIKKVQSILSNNKTRINSFLKKDVFEKEIKTEGDILENKIKTRNFPNSIGIEEDIITGTGGQIRFFQEDITKMKAMSTDKAKEYRAHLIAEGRFIKEPASYNNDELL